MFSSSERFFIFIFKYFFILPELQTPPLLSHFTFPPTAIPLLTPYIPLLHSFTILHILYHPSTSAFTNDTPLLSSSISPPPTSPTFPLIYPFLLSSIFCLWCVLLYVGIMYATQIYFLFIFNCFRFSLSLLGRMQSCISSYRWSDGGGYFLYKKPSLTSLILTRTKFKLWNSEGFNLFSNISPPKPQHYLGVILEYFRVDVLPFYGIIPGA